MTCPTIDKLYTESLIDIVFWQNRFEAFEDLEMIIEELGIENQEFEIQNLETEIQISNSENQNPVSKTGKLDCKN